MLKAKIRNKAQAGFTLLEIGIVLLLAGGTMLAAARAAKVYTINLQYDNTLENLRFAQNALDEFVGLNGFYPCPADPTLDSTQVNYGVSLCRDYTLATFDPDNCSNIPGSIQCTCLLYTSPSPRD